MFSDLLQRIITFDDHSPLLFTQFYFWAFLAVVLLVLSLVGRKVLLRNAFLFLVSVFFYYKTSGVFTLILLFAVLSNYAVGLLLGKAATDLRRRLWLATGVVLNLLVLCYFKYAYFFADLVNNLCGTSFDVVDYFALAGNALAGQDYFRVDQIALPVGISFYTFQCISYLMDIFRGRIAPERNILNYGFYVSFFPQLVAGPIVRANEFMHQLSRPSHVSRRVFGIAVFWILNGLAKKIILSDYIAVNFIDRVFENPTLYSGFENLLALFGYSLQVYADFSGYTDIAIGVAMTMGFYLPTNFRSPYKATNAGGFWKRWHISLSKWLQDYLYIPMGGNRNATFATWGVILTIAAVGTILSNSIWVAVVVLAIAAVCGIVLVAFPQKKKLITTNVNSMNTMLLGGLWHGASWNFMIWGGLNGLGMIVFKLWKPLSINLRALVATAFAALAWWLSLSNGAAIWNIAAIWLGATAVGAVIRMIYNLLRFPWTLAWAEKTWAIAQTFVFITFTRLFFRSGSNLDPAEANETAWNTAQSMVTQIGGSWKATRVWEMVLCYREIIGLIILGMIIHWLPERLKRTYRIAFARMPLWLMALVSVVVVFVVYQFVTADLQKFIYFQF